MKISAGNWQNQSISRPGADRTADASNNHPEEEKAQSADEQKSAPYTPASKQTAHGGGASGKIRSSLPDDQVGALAIQLANSQTKLDVQQVSAKALRSLASLKMCCISCDEKDKKKVLQMIRRTEKLIKRIRTKMRCLTKEEDLEKRRKKAEKKEQEQEARELQDELRSRQRKRRREEWDYALKESTQNNNSSDNIPLPVSSAGAPTTVGTVDASVSADVASAMAAESVSLDVTV